MSTAARDDRQAVRELRRMLLAHLGPLSPDLLNELCNELRGRLRSLGVSATLQHRVFLSFLEVAQNVLHYAEPAGGLAPLIREGGRTRREATLTLDQVGEAFQLTCENRLRATFAPRLASRLDALRGMSEAQLHDAYRRQLRKDDHEQRDTQSRGAGLGLLTVARHASGPLDYELRPDPASQGELFVFTLVTRIAPRPGSAS